ncbi:hypothetical protein COU96_01775 [Candidatus Shapirobacteria bacterium CG10_big_fil_rev_8_21_14_0_10_38_14]|uniref:DUF1846 domain-containing protein n=1 Tax=Candidatus Shapirobacteria bacterium CG10_big_fil_rev_8_21_14_0_10_38_14 TaxID=1974483 RepID=A0A2M8L5J3_9BACT|nr:MAG: hypothetical protein COU96_01775 [Candidatus Shapirobacteria bacterium CG10_big_fil_rev_8_21_14_0_10_38_14]
MKTKKLGFDTEKYLKAQEKAIQKRLNKADKLYLEFGGKLLFDGHAARTLPGYDPTAKLILLKRLRKDLEILVSVSAKELQKGKIHGDTNLNNEEFTLKILGELNNHHLPVAAVVINRFEGEPTALEFEKRLKRLGLKTYKRKEIPNYLADTDFVISKKGYGADPFIKTTKPIVLVTAPAPNGGKLSTCLGQLYHENKKGRNAAYAKFETFPVWNLPLKHPVNIAYEASTADLLDFNLVDPFHLEAYGKTAINYNRDVAVFPIIQKLLQKVIPANNLSVSYKSPTDMGVNCIKEGIVDDKIVCQAAKQEIIFYYFRHLTETKKGFSSQKALQKVELLMKELNLKPENRKAVPAARKAFQEAQKQRNKGEKGTYCGAAIELPEGQIITGKNSPLLHAEAAAVLNAIKILAGIPDKIDLLSPQIISGANQVKQEILKEKSESLNLSEVLIALSMASVTNPTANQALKCLTQLRSCQMHTTHIPARGDESAFRKLGLWVTTDANVPLSKAFFY